MRDEPIDLGEHPCERGRMIIGKLRNGQRLACVHRVMEYAGIWESTREAYAESNSSFTSALPNSQVLHKLDGRTAKALTISFIT